MNALVKLLAVVVWLIFAGGCALPRAFAIRHEIDQSVPVLPAAKITSISIDPTFASSSAALEINSDADQATTVAWYRHQLESAHWREFPDRARSDIPPATTQLYFQRESHGLPKEWRPLGGMFDVLILDFTDQTSGSGTHIHISFHVPKYSYTDYLTFCLWWPWAYGEGHAMKGSAGPLPIF